MGGAVIEPADATIAVHVEPACAPLADAAELRCLIAHALAAEGVGGAGPPSLTLVLTDDATIRDLNRRFLGHDEPTDVLAFPFEGAPGEGEGVGAGFVGPADGAAGPRPLGEIYVSCERAAAQSGDWDTSPAEEVRFLTLHGVLHLLGWDDATPDRRRAMLDRQAAILAGWAAGGSGG